MSKAKSRVKNVTSKPSGNSWKEAISYVDSEIKEAKKRIDLLERAKSTFRKMDAEGEPFPGQAGAA